MEPVTMAVRSISVVRTSSKPVLIYGLIDPSTKGLRYVGKTVNPAHRLRCHIGDARRGAKSYHHNWVRQCIAAGGPPQMIELETVRPGDDWVEAEQFWISNARFLGCNLTNQCEGGQGTDGYRFLPAQIERLRLAHLGRVMTPEQKEKRSQTMVAKRAAGWKKKSHPKESVERGVRTRQALLDAGLIKTRKGVKATAEQVERISAARRAIDSPEFRAKISAAKKGKRLSAEGRSRQRQAQQLRREAERAAGGTRFSAEGLANMLAGQQRRRKREKMLGIPGAPRPSDDQIARFYAGRRRYAERQNAAKQK